jgi:hypothetical protein
VRRVAYEAADAGLPSPELAAGIRRVKGVRRPGRRSYSASTRSIDTPVSGKWSSSGSGLTACCWL